MTLDPKLLDYVIDAAIEKKIKEYQKLNQAIERSWDALATKERKCRTAFVRAKQKLEKDLVQEHKEAFEKEFNTLALPKFKAAVKALNIPVKKPAVKIHSYVYFGNRGEKVTLELCATVTLGTYSSTTRKDVALTGKINRGVKPLKNELTRVEQECKEARAKLAKLPQYKKPTAQQKVNLAAKLLNSKNVNAAIKKALSLL